MKKFDEWNSIKKKLEGATSNRVNFCEREIWWCSLGENVGFEQNGKNNGFERPVLVYKKFNKEIFFGIPLSSRYKNNRFYFLLDYPETSALLLSQLRLLDSKRLKRKLRNVSLFEYKNIQKSIRNLV